MNVCSSRLQIMAEILTNLSSSKCVIVTGPRFDASYRFSSKSVCDECDREHLGDCPIHGPLMVVQDNPVADGDYLRADHSIPLGLSISKSAIKGAGLGVWTDVPIPKGVRFGPYAGEVIYDAAEASASGYCWEIVRKRRVSGFVDGKDVAKSNWMRYVNCANREAGKNLLAFQYHGQMYYRTFEAVPAGTELLVWYGDEYAAELGLPCQSPPTTDAGGLLFECDACKRQFACKDALARHFRRKHPPSDRRHKCALCPYSTDRLGDYTTHLRRHNQEKRFVCCMCPMAFVEKRELVIHQRTHTGERPFACPQCGRRFIRSSDRSAHLRTHSKDAPPPYGCPTCSKRFNRFSAVARHVLTHTGQKPFACDACAARFNRKSNLKRHVISKHTREFRHRCPVCDRGFLAKGPLHKHAIKCHQLPPEE